MGKPLSKSATRTGDNGSTGLGDGSRTSKDSLRIHAMGEVDELNSQLGLLLCEAMPDTLRGELLREEHLLRLDAMLAHYNADLPALTEFILPAGSRAASLAHVCRTVCRRAERSIVALANAETLNAYSRQYVNRLSDLLFVLSRLLNRFAGGGDVLWRHERTRG